MSPRHDLPPSQDLSGAIGVALVLVLAIFVVAAAVAKFRGWQ